MLTLIYLRFSSATFLWFGYDGCNDHLSTVGVQAAGSVSVCLSPMLSPAPRRVAELTPKLVPQVNEPIKRETACESRGQWGSGRAEGVRASTGNKPCQRRFEGGHVKGWTGTS